MEKVAYRSSTRVIALSPGMKQGICRTGYLHRHVHVLPNCSDTDLFQIDRAAGQAFRNRFEWLQDRPLIVYCGALGAVNGVDVNSPLAAAKMIVDKISDDSWIRSASEAALVLAKNEFSRDIIAGKLEKLLLKVVSSSSLSRAGNRC